MASDNFRTDSVLPRVVHSMKINWQTYGDDEEYKVDRELIQRVEPPNKLTC